MTRKRCHRRPVPAMPKWLRPKLQGDQVRDLALAHITNLDDVANGRGTPDVMWQMTGGVLTWGRVAQHIGQHVDAMRDQSQMMHALILRWQRTGRVLFTGAEYQLAKHGVQVMDDLAALVDRATAVEAAAWSEEQLQHIVAAAEAAHGHAAHQPAPRRTAHAKDWPFPQPGSRAAQAAGPVRGIRPDGSDTTVDLVGLPDALL